MAVRSHPTDRAAARRGFTLAELMIALVIGSILVAIVLQFVSGQTRTAAAQSAREQVQQNARGALEIVGSDLRGAIGKGLLRADEQRLDFMLPRRWGVVCGTAGGTATTALFPIIPGDPIPTGEGAGLIVLRGTDWLPAVPTLATVVASVPAALASCPGAAGNVQAVTLSGTGHPAAVAGDRIAVYQLVRYDVGEAQGEQWIRRSDGAGIAGRNMQPLAGPVDAEFVRFDYLRGNPPVSIGAAPGGAAAASNIEMIRFRVRTTSRMRADGGKQVEEDSVTVQIRN
ncbi:MAG: prepilin-type N-terminal cleavage/methylation domain-containing protein [Gemmatimonadetes bacterium]|nr:prepilin-type N-terminal cleavage/methylation domain-containing protein [Gemmatimonadota bacterium]